MLSVKLPMIVEQNFQAETQGGNEREELTPLDDLHGAGIFDVKVVLPWQGPPDVLHDAISERVVDGQ